MAQGYVIPVDPAELASRFPSHNPQADDDELGGELEGVDISTEEMSAFFADGDYESRIAPLLDRIPEREADLIYLYFIQRKRQADIASIFGVTQAAISYRLDRGIQRIKFLLSIPQVTDDELRKCELQIRNDCSVCVGKGSILIDVEILVGMWGTTCQSEVAKKLGLTQGRVRHRFFTAVKVLEKAAGENERFVPYHRIFSSISNKHFNVLREVKLPQWQDRGGDECI
jgi:DNA-directed RNA polymerase specialized sigma24 family protein